MKRAAKAKREHPKGLERRVPSEDRCHLKRSEEAARAAKGQRAGRRDERRSGLESPFAKAAKTLGHEETWSEEAPLSEFCTECTAVIPLICVECYNITILPREYSKMLAVRG